MWVSTSPSSSIKVSRSAAGSNTAPRWAPDARTRSATRRVEAAMSNVRRPIVEEYGLTASTSARSFVRTLAMASEAEP